MESVDVVFDGMTNLHIQTTFHSEKFLIHSHIAEKKRENKQKRKEDQEQHSKTEKSSCAALVRLLNKMYFCHSCTTLLWQKHVHIHTMQTLSSLPAATPRSPKAQIRSECKQRRMAMSSMQRAMASFEIAEQFAALPEFAQAQYIHVYCSFGAEAETGVIIGRAFDAGKRVVVPLTPVVKIYSKNEELAKTLLHTEIDPEQPFGYDRHGMPAPLPMNREDPTAALDYCTPATLFSPRDVVVVPLVAFDSKCYRLGYGQGFYDRFLTTLKPTRCLTIGIAFECQFIDVLPTEPHDEPVDIIITERRVVRREGSTEANAYHASVAASDELVEIK
jgi:5-formyltetrahydrofolate cyclo-ligase